MVSRRFLAILVYALPILVVAFGILMGSQALAEAMRDDAAAMALRWTGIFCLMALILDLLLLVGTLGVDALNKRDNPAQKDGS